MKKKIYQAPEAEIQEFIIANIISTSDSLEYGENVGGDIYGGDEF